MFSNLFNFFQTTKEKPIEPVVEEKGSAPEEMSDEDFDKEIKKMQEDSLRSIGPTLSLEEFINEPEIKRQQSYKYSDILESKNLCQDENKPRITIFMFAHGNDLPKQDLVGVIGRGEYPKVRIFSEAGKLGILGFCNSINYRRLTLLGRTLSGYFNLLLKQYFNDSSYLTIKYILSDLQRDYLSVLKKGFEHESVLSENSELTEKEKIDIEEKKEHMKKAIEVSEQEKHFRTYVPTFNKLYSFVEPKGSSSLQKKFMKIVHIDSVDSFHESNIDFVDLKELFGFIESLNKPAEFKRKTREIIFANIKDRLYKDGDKIKISFLYLKNIIAICKIMGFKTINIIDFSCRHVDDPINEDELREIIAKEERVTKEQINPYCGGMKKKRRSRKRRSYKKGKTRRFKKLN